MEYTYAVGCLFLGLVLVCAQGQSQYRGSICKRRGSDDCKLPLDCGKERISVIKVETGYSICNSTACKFCCNVNLLFNQNLTKEVKQYCEDLYQCEPGSLILASPGVGNAIIWFECKDSTTIVPTRKTQSQATSGVPLLDYSTFIQKNQSTTTAANDQSSRSHVTALFTEVISPQNMNKDDNDDVPLIAVVVPTLLVLIVVVVVLVVLLVRRHKMKTNSANNYNDFNVSLNRTKGNIVVVNNIYGENTAPKIRSKTNDTQLATDHNAVDEMYNTTNDHLPRHQLDTYDHVTRNDANIYNYASAFVWGENDVEQKYDRTQGEHPVNDSTYDNNTSGSRN